MQKTYTSLLSNRHRLSAVRLAILVLALAGLMLAGLAPAATAQTAQNPAAQTTQDPDQLQVRNPAPSCVSTYVTRGIATNKVSGTNNCTFDVRFKVIIGRVGNDSECKALKPGQHYSHKYPRWATFEGLENC